MFLRNSVQPLTDNFNIKACNSSTNDFFSLCIHLISSIANRRRSVTIEANRLVYRKAEQKKKIPPDLLRLRRIKADYFR